MRTLAYVVSECTTDPEGRSSLGQKLVVRRGNCDPVTIVEYEPSSPVVDPSGLCRRLADARSGQKFARPGVFHGMAVLPDDSGIVFDVSKENPGASLTPDPPEEGIFFARPDGSGLRKLGPPSRAYEHLTTGDFRWAVSPDGRHVAFIDFGPSREGHDAPQVFILDLRTGERRQLTAQPRVPMPLIGDPGLWFPSFLDNRTVGFYAGSTGAGTFKAFQVKTDGSAETEVPPITTTSGARVVTQFAITGQRRPHALLGLFPSRPGKNRPDAFAREVFLFDGEDLLQLTAFGFSDTGPGGSGARGVLIGDRVFFVATADPLRKNPHGICQIFSISTLGVGLRQVTHLPWDGRSSNEGCRSVFPGCGVYIVSTAADQVTGIVLFSASCDPFGRNPFGEQIFAMRPDGKGLRQLTDAPGRTFDPDGTVHVEVPGPFAYTESAGR
jgi:hypothetical protein